MTAQTARFFTELAQREVPLANLTPGTLRIELREDGRTEYWHLTFGGARATVSQHDAAADCVLRTDQALFDRITAGEVNAVAAFLRGQVEVEGDPNMIVVLERLFPGAARTEERQAS